MQAEASTPSPSQHEWDVFMHMTRPRPTLWVYAAVLTAAYVVDPADPRPFAQRLAQLLGLAIVAWAASRVWRTATMTRIRARWAGLMTRMTRGRTG
jgi:hypothetical protein